MAIPARQIGWSDKDNLLWNISKQLEVLTGTFSKLVVYTTTTTTTTTNPLGNFYYTVNRLDCNNACAILNNNVLVSSNTVVNFGSFYKDSTNTSLIWQIVSLAFSGTAYADISASALTTAYSSCSAACGYTTTTSSSTSTSTSTTTSSSTTTIPYVGCYGLLYNGYAITNSSPIANTNAHIPTYTDVDSLIMNFGGYSLAGGALKQTGTTYWDTPNTGANNSSRFTALGSGWRYVDGSFYSLNQIMFFWTTYATTGSLYIPYDSTNVSFQNNGIAPGLNIRLVVDTPNYIYPDGHTGTYIGNDGKSYYCVLIGTQWWLAENLRETKYRNGTNIPEVTSNAAWAALTTGARCTYNNNSSYVNCVPSAPPPYIPSSTTTTTTTVVITSSTTTTTTTSGILGTLFIHIPNKV